MAKKIMFLLFSGLLSFALMGCESDDDGGSGALGGGDSAMVGEVYTAVAAAMSTAQSSNRGTAPSGGTIDYDDPNGYWSATGTYSIDTTTGASSYDIDFTWNGYTSGNVTLVSGTANCTLDISSDSSMTYAYDGTFVVLYNDIQHNFSWDIDVTSDGSSYSITGEYTVDGATYSYSNNINY